MTKYTWIKWKMIKCWKISSDLYWYIIGDNDNDNNDVDWYYVFDICFCKIHTCKRARERHKCEHNHKQNDDTKWYTDWITALKIAAIEIYYTTLSIAHTIRTGCSKSMHGQCFPSIKSNRPRWFLFWSLWWAQKSFDFPPLFFILNWILKFFFTSSNYFWVHPVRIIASVLCIMYRNFSLFSSCITFQWTRLFVCFLLLLLLVSFASHILPFYTMRLCCCAMSRYLWVSLHKLPLCDNTDQFTCNGIVGTYVRCFIHRLSALLLIMMYHKSKWWMSLE